jgi:hypothetical protein
LIAGERFAAPVEADEAERPVLNPYSINGKEPLPASDSKSTDPSDRNQHPVSTSWQEGPD